MCEILDRVETKGEIRGTVKTLARLVQDGILTLTEAARRANMSTGKFKKEAGLRVDTRKND